ncbi:MAG TPA: MtrB/PioB family outer membrane beta-barrel protein [Vicinamibacterales bacterium]|nr:MtrB/PioB family outer membrane beta-barrel protein [Vicinamibacterales bacterium]
MRLTRVLSALALTALPAVVFAQTPATATDPAAAPAPQAAAQPATTESMTGVSTGWVDFGIRGSSITGDTARYNRYRDLGDGLFAQTLRFSREEKGYEVSANAVNVARNDAYYEGRLVKPGKLKGWITFDQIPMLMSNTTETLYREVSPGVFRVDNSLQQTMQATTANAAKAAVLNAFAANNAQTFDLGSQRHLGEVGTQYLLNPETAVNVKVSYMSRHGAIPLGNSFGIGSAISVENPAPVDQHSTDFDVNAEHQAGRVLFRLGYTGSFFRNDTTQIIFDNANILTDTAAASSQGRATLPPSNNWQNVTGLVAYTMSHHSRLLGAVSFGSLSDVDATIIPNTINSVTPVTPLERSSVDGKARTTAVNLSFTSSPARNVGVDVKYRMTDYKNETPAWTVAQRIPYDNTPTVGPFDAARYGGARNYFDGAVTFHTVADSNVRVGYMLNQANYEDRIFTSSKENSFYISFDRLASDWLMLHTKYEYDHRAGSGLETSELTADGEQALLRTFDIADRNRNLFTLTASFVPGATKNLSLNATAGVGSDDYPNSVLGLNHAKHYVWSLGADSTPRDNVTASVSYSYDSFDSLSWSTNQANANQPRDLTKDWSTDGKDHVYSFLALVDTRQLLKNKVDLRVSYDFNRGSSDYVYGLASPTTLATPSQLPTVQSDLNRLTFNSTFWLTSKVGVGFEYWFEKYTVSDFAMDATGIPQINMPANLTLAPSSILLGYQYLPYTAHTFWGHLIYHW